MRKSCIGPGFRFHPTDVELVMYYLKRKLLKKRLVSEVIAEVNIYDYSPWDLPDKSNLRNGDLEWFFFCSKSRKYSSGSRVNRATSTGYWKATGKDREVKYKEKTVAIIKTLVFHLGHPPKGTRTDWVMHEYRMDDIDLANTRVLQEEYVLCKLFKKSGAGPKNGAQYGAPFKEEEWDDDDDDEVNVSRGTTETLTNVTLTEPGPVIAASSENERHFEESTVTSSEKESRFEESAVTSLAKFGQMGTTKALQVPYASSSTMTNLTPIERGPSTSTNSEGRHEDLHANDDMITREDIALILHNNKSQDVEDYKGKKIMSDKPNEDKVVFLDSATLDDLSQDGFDTFSVDWFSGSMLDPITEDDLDDDLGKFFCG